MSMEVGERGFHAERVTEPARVAIVLMQTFSEVLPTAPILHPRWLYRTGLLFLSTSARLDVSPPPVLLFVHHGQRARTKAD